MKKNLFILCLIPYFLTGQSIFLSDPVEVSTDGTSLRAPRIALLDGNRPVVYWGKTGSVPKMYLAIWDNGSFGAPIELNTNGQEPDLWGGGLGPQIVTQGNTIFLVFESYGEGIFCIKSDDGGQNFSSPGSVWNAPQGRVATLPSISIDPDGHPIISFVTTNFSEQDAQYEITKSIDGGLSFPPTTLANSIVPGDEVCECCPATIVAPTTDEVYLGFRNNNNNLRDVWIAQSTDNNSTFSTATDIDNTDWTVSSCPQSGPDMIVEGDSIFSVYYSGASGSNVYFSSLNTSNMEVGYQFQMPAFSGVQSSAQNFAAIAGHGDTLGVIWQELGLDANDIILAWSTSGSADLINNFVAVGDGPASQKQGDIAFQDGIFHIVYEDHSQQRVMYRTASFEEIVSTPHLHTSDEFTFDISPNPIQEKTTITFDNKQEEVVSIQLTNTNGQIIRTFKTTGSSLDINKNDLLKGSNFITIIKGKQQATKQIIHHQ